MERTLSPDERIRRAEEIYYRKKIQATDKRSARVNVSDKKSPIMLKKMILQIIICTVIYSIFYMVQNTNYIFSEDVIKKVNEILSYDININVLYEQGKQYVNGLIYKEDKQEENDSEQSQEENSGGEQKQEENVALEEAKQDETTPAEEVPKPVEDSNQNEGVGGENVEINKEEVASITEAEQDAKDVIETVELISPLKGTITSRFGPRESDNPIVSKYHTGIDIAVNEGTVFTSAMSGIVTKVSSEGAYGNHVKIVSGDVMTLYAHCKTIYVNEGDEIVAGQQLGEVGDTGNATGPHLHFEVRKEDRYVNPDLILEF